MSDRKLVYADQVRGAILKVAPSAAFVVDRISAVDAVPVRYGEWLLTLHEDPRGDFSLYHCSECDSPNARQRNFCPECGAKMRNTAGEDLMKEENGNV
jgi:hypothetical protein